MTAVGNAHLGLSSSFDWESDDEYIVKRPQAPVSLSTYWGNKIYELAKENRCRNLRQCSLLAISKLVKSRLWIHLPQLLSRLYAYKL